MQAKDAGLSDDGESLGIFQVVVVSFQQRAEINFAGWIEIVIVLVDDLSEKDRFAIIVQEIKNLTCFFKSFWV